MFNEMGRAIHIALPMGPNSAFVGTAVVVLRSAGPEARADQNVTVAVTVSL